jgi:hypothetical protein
MVPYVECDESFGSNETACYGCDSRTESTVTAKARERLMLLTSSSRLGSAG